MTMRMVWYCIIIITAFKLFRAINESCCNKVNTMKYFSHSKVQLVAITERGQTSKRLTTDRLETRKARFFSWCCGARPAGAGSPHISSVYFSDRNAANVVCRKMCSRLDQLGCQERSSIIIAFDEHCVKLRSHRNALKFKYSRLA